MGRARRGRGAFWFFLGAGTAMSVSALANSDATYARIATFARALHYIENHYVHPITDETLVYGAIRGMVSTLDRHSKFMDPKELEALRKEADQRIEHGPKVVTSRWLEPSLAYIRLRSFTEDSFRGIKSALAALRAEGPIEGLILDLRGNSGGLLEQGVRIADLWIDEGLIVSTHARGKEREAEYAHPIGTEPDYPMWIMIDSMTASASEVVAGALQDHGRAKLIGAPSFGKGSVQTLIELEDGSALRLTVAHYFTPKGRSLGGKGLTPDVSLGEVDEEVALARAVEALKGNGTKSAAKSH